jgi:hypothetical protein
MRFAPLLAPLFYANLAFLCDKISLKGEGRFGITETGRGIFFVSFVKKLCALCG